MMLLLRRILIIVISTRLNMAWLNRWRTDRIQHFITMLDKEFTPFIGQRLCPYLMLMGNGVNSCGAIRDAIAPYGLHLTELVYKLPHLSREDIKAMLELNDIELKQTRFYQEIAEEERQEECIALLTRQLRRKFGLQPQLEAILPRLPELPLERLEDLADALLDFSQIDELQAWLNHSP